jgi:hypothetical protein
VNNLWILFEETVFGKKRKITCSDRLLSMNYLRAVLRKTNLEGVDKYCQIVYFKEILEEQ